MSDDQNPMTPGAPESKAEPTAELQDAYIIRHESGWNRDLSNFHVSPSSNTTSAAGLARIVNVDRPWGSIRRYAENEPCTTMLITINPGEALNLHMHAKRSELWVILDDGAEATVDGRTFPLAAGQEVWLDPMIPHCIRSLGPAIRFVEVAYGEWEQSDIIFPEPQPA